MTIELNITASYAIDSDVGFERALGKIVRHSGPEVARTKSMMKGILWDNDGVLIDTEGLFFQATRNVLRSAGVELSRERYVEWSLRQGRSCFDLLREQGWTLAQIAELRFQRDQAYSRMLANGPGMMDGILEVLTLLRAKFRMAIVTTSRREHFELMHQRSNLSQFFEFAVTREDYGRSKPHPEPYLTALERLQLSAKECIAIEDSERGLAAANAAGLHCIVIPNSMTMGSAFGDAAMVISDAAALPGALFRFARTPSF